MLIRLFSRTNALSFIAGRTLTHHHFSLQRAIKRLKGSFNWDTMVTMRELQSLMRLSLHPNVVRLYEVHRSTRGEVCFCFEYMPDGSLHDVMMHRLKHNMGPFPDIPNILQQVLHGLDHLHQSGFMHRDIKPENILMHGSTAKVADFSLARGRPQDSLMTQYVSTRWYRAPEVLLGAPVYDCKVDIFAIGCIAAELYSLKPLFPGAFEMDQLLRIFSVLGPPTSRTWNQGCELLRRLALSSDGAVRPLAPPEVLLSQFMPNVPSVTIDFVHRLLILNPQHRLSAQQALRHEYFGGQTCCSTTPDSSNTSNLLPAVSVSPSYPHKH